jgi:hypothetical protein
MHEGTPELYDGSGLFAADGLLHVSLGNGRTVQALDGLVHLTRYDDAIVVAAISTPALVSIHEKRVLVAPGRQWRSDGSPLPSEGAGLPIWLRARETSAIPRSTLQEQVHNSALLPVAAEPHVQSSGGLSLLLPSSVPLLPGARERTDNAHRQDALRNLAAAVDARRSDTVTEQLQQGILAASLHLPDVQQALAGLLLQSADHADSAAPLAAALARNPDLWLLCTLHPRVSAVTGVFAEPLLTGDALLIDTLMLPGADVRSDPLGDMALRRWAERAADTLLDTADPLVLLEPFVHQMDGHIEALMAMEYPERAHALAARAIDVVSTHVRALDPASLAILDRWQRLDAVSTAPVQMQDIAPPVEPSESAKPGVSTAPEQLAERTVPDAEVEAKVLALLAEAGAMFTLTTEVSITGDTTADVRKIVISTPTRDRTFSFTIDVERRTVRSVVEAGTEYLYELPLEQFMAWARSDT